MLTRVALKSPLMSPSPQLLDPRSTWLCSRILFNWHADI